MKFKYDCLNNRFWRIESEYTYEISEELAFTDSYGGRGFVLDLNQPSQWITFTFYDRIIRVFYRQVSKSKVDGSEVVTCYQKDIPKEAIIEFELTKKDIVMKRDDRWIKKNS